jgi:hypothetical protein
MKMPNSIEVERPKRFKLSDEVYEEYLKNIPRLNNSDARENGESFFDAMRRNMASFEALRFNGKSVDEIIRDL